jgi:DNA repair exonuclease SbcCD ATPase subunit
MEERIRQIAEYYGISIRQFEQKISVSDGLIHKALARKSGLKQDTLAKILDIFPQINPDWLLSGKGEMLRGSDREKPSDTTVSILLQRIEDLARENGSLQAQIDEYKKEIALLQRSASPPAAKTASA